MKKTTIYLPHELKARVKAVARNERRSEADIIRDAITAAVGLRSVPVPRVPLTKKGLGDPTIAERVDELLCDPSEREKKRADPAGGRALSRRPFSPC